MKINTTLIAIALVFMGALVAPQSASASSITTLATLGIKTSGLAFDTAGNLYTLATDYSNGTGRILKITPSGTVTTFVSLGTTYSLSSLAFDTAGNLYAAAYGPTILDASIFKITPSGVITTFYKITYPADSALYGSNVEPSSLAFDAAGNLYVAHVKSNTYWINNFIYKITPSGVVSNFVNLGDVYISSIAFDATGNLYAVDQQWPMTGTIYKVTPAGIVTKFVSLAASANTPNYLAFDTAGNLFVASSANNTIYKITSAGAVTNFPSSYNAYPISLAFDAAGNLYSLDYIPMTISKFTTNMVVYSNNSSSNWTITGPATITGSGTFQSTLGNPSGTYTITWGAVPGYTNPVSQSLTLTNGGTITFNGTYTALTACSATTISNCSLTATASGNSAGNCSTGYSGSCNYTCTNGTWAPNSNSCTLTCGTVQDASGNTYNTVVIGTQCWMAENLRTTKKPDGTNLTEGSGMYSNPAGSGSPWGKLYDWNTAMNGAPAATAPGAEIQGICPTGWHIPSNYYPVGSIANRNEDFYKLSDFLGGDDVSGGKLKQTGTVYWNSPNSGATNSSGFSGVGAGYVAPPSGFDKNDLYLVSSGKFLPNWGWTLQVSHLYSASFHETFSVTSGISVRCIKSSTCNLPWGGTAPGGTVVTAYQSSFVTSPTTCASVSQTRTCTNGVFVPTFTYTNPSCSVTPAPCTTAWGAYIPSSASVTAYQFIAVKSPKTCSSVSQTSVCTNGVFVPTLTNYPNQNCKVQPTFQNF